MIIEKRLLICCLMASLALTGCKQIRDMDVFSGGSSSDNRSEGTKGKFIESVKDDLSDDDGASAAELKDGWKEDVGYVRYGNKTIANLPQLQTYVNEVVGNLSKGVPGKAATVTVYITPQKDFEAYTLENGAIFVSLGTLLALKSEDELAALMAHEYAHVLLGHHSKNTFELLTKYGMRYANIYLQSKAGSGQAQKNQMNTLKLASWVTDKALFPNWNKGQENDADILAVDLLVRAGYNADAMAAMLKKVEQTIQEKKDFVAKNPIKVSEDAKATSKLNVDLDVLAANAIGSLENQLDRDYESAKVRQKRVRDYLKREYRKRPRPSYLKAAYSARFQQKNTKPKLNQYLSAHQAEQMLMLNQKEVSKAAKLASKAIGGSLGEDPYTRMLMYYIRTSQKLTDKAQINLDKAYATGGAPMYTYELLLKQTMSGKKYPRAKKLLEEMEKEFDDPAEILPNIITVEKKLGNITTMYRLRCMASADVELIKQCERAADK